MALFKKQAPAQAFLKMGIYGNAGSGKTYTASLVAAGLVQHVGEKTDKRPPVMFLDTENGSPWIRSVFDEAGVEFYSAQTRAFTDLMQAVREAEAQQSVLIVDSITHFWMELCQTFAKSRRRDHLEFQDYAVLKPQWGTFTEAFLNSKAHIILCGRAGNTYDYQDTERSDGSIKKELITTGTKMKAEKEMGYEPSLLVEMTAEKSPDRKKKLTIRKAYVVKDRGRVLDGREFINPGFKVFTPHIEYLNIGGAHTGFDASRNSADLFDENGRPEWQQRKQDVASKLEEIENILVKYYPGQSANDKRTKVVLLEKHFGTNAWTKIKLLPLEKLNIGYESLRADLELNDDCPIKIPTSTDEQANHLN
jgi:hypothetical protein